MVESTRRTLLKSATAGALSLAVKPVSLRAADSDKAIVGVIGTGGMGMNHVRQLSRRDDVEITWVSDVDSQRLSKAVEHVKSETGRNPQATSDLRRILEDERIDAVFIATPDHWHGPAAILALNAGKHVYVEKPCCHNLHEGMLMAEAVERTGMHLQVGTQSRSTECVKDAIDRIRDGQIGEVLVAKAWNSQKRRSIGKSQPAEPPAHLDFDLWCGPAPLVSYRPNMLHGIWRWWYDFGCGDIGNDGVHDIDVALWGLNVEGLPNRVTCCGGKYYFDDDQQFPDTQYSISEFDVEGTPSGRRKQLVFEQRDWTPYTQEGYENGAAFYGTDGMLIMGHTVGWKLYGPRNKLIAERTGPAELVAHHTNFLNCIRGVEQSTNASINAGLQSAAIVHLSNIAARTGISLEVDSSTGRITNDAVSNALIRRKYRQDHWAVPRT